MAFGSSQQKQSQPAEGRTESPYLKLAAGERTIRILDAEETSFWRYFIEVNVGGVQRGRSIVVSMDNPIKRMMASLGPEHPQFRKVERRMLLNVLDRTPVVRWTDGTTLYADAGGVYHSPESGAILSNPVVVPNNRVMILEFGPQLMDFFVMYDGRVRNPEDMAEVLPIQRLDLSIMTMGSGLTTKRTVMTSGDISPLPAELANLPKYDLRKLTQPMPNEAIQRILDGADYGDVLKSLGWERIQPLW